MKKILILSCMTGLFSCAEPEHIEIDEIAYDCYDSFTYELIPSNDSIKWKVMFNDALLNTKSDAGTGRFTYTDSIHWKGVFLFFEVKTKEGVDTMRFKYLLDDRVMKDTTLIASPYRTIINLWLPHMKCEE